MHHRDYFVQHPRWGKILGAVLGFIMAGPVGAFLGIIAGNFFDQGLAQHLSKPNQPFRNEPRLAVKSLFIDATFSAMGWIAKADGRVSETSIQMAQQLMSELGLNHQQRSQAQQYFNQGKQSHVAATSILLQLKSAAFDNPQLLKLFITIQYQHAERKGLSNKTLIRLNEIFNIMGFASFEEQMQFTDAFFQHTTNRQNHRRYSSSSSSTWNQSNHTLDSAYTQLRIKPDASKDEIKRAYRRLISEHHPDKMIAKGASVDAIKAANTKSQAITKAYEQICKNRGW